MNAALLDRLIASTAPRFCMAPTRHGLPHAGVLAGAAWIWPTGSTSASRSMRWRTSKLSKRDLVLPKASDEDPNTLEVSVKTSRPFAVRFDLVLIGKRW
jgi:hypothetical protein